jgi:hypothetical protein
VYLLIIEEKRNLTTVTKAISKVIVVVDVVFAPSMFNGIVELFYVFWEGMPFNK